MNAMEGPYKKGDFIGGKYEIYNTLGKGGYGIVYLVYSHETHSVFALKTLQDEHFWNARIRERFRREAQTWIDLGRHLYLVRAYHVDEVSGRLYIAMEYIGPNELGLNSLDRYLEHKPPDLKQTLRWSIQFCHGMEHAYSRGIRCHRDIKAENIMVTRDETVKITDFSLVGIFETEQTASGTRRSIHHRETGSSSHTKEEWNIGGSPTHMPPEQFINPASCDQRSDVYSFGVVLFEMVSGGEFPFLPPSMTKKELASSRIRKDRTFWEEMYKLHSDAPLPRLNSVLFPIVQKCLEKNPEKRYHTFKKLREDLEPLLKRETGEEIMLPILQESEVWEWNNKGVSLDNLGRHEEAIGCYDKALEINPNYMGAWNNKGNSLDESGRHGEAVSCYDRVLEIDPNNVKAWNNKGVSLQAMGRYDEALRCFDEALEVDTRFIEAWNNRGTCLQILGHPFQAIHCYDRALEIDPKHAKAWNNKGVSLQAMGRYDEAALCHDRALIINPGNAEAWSNIGNSFGNLGRHEEAIRCYERALEIDPTLIKAWNNKGNSLRDLNRLDEAIRCYDRALEIDPKYAGAWFNRALAEMSLGKKGEAIRSFNQFIALTPPRNSRYVDFARLKIKELEGG